ncbi:MAG: hypothetical protein IPL23_15670 [Saprospiraceae bacterium]|nr:hypothetical protein [Saprospiraceae bacterium]
MTYKIIGLVLIVGLVFYITSCKNISSAATNKKVKQIQDTTQPKKVDPNNNPYQDLRSLAFGATMEQIGVNFSADQTKIYGVIMDWDVGEGTATLVAFLSGDASLYLSSGGGVIGGSGHDNVNQAAANFISKAQKYLSNTVKTDTTPLPGKDGVKFYFLTNKGKFVGQEEVKNFDNNSSQWLGLFEEGNKLITEIRMVADMK